MTRILPADPQACAQAHRDEIDAAIRETLDGGTYVLGPAVTAFERELAAALGGGEAVGVASGTDALVLALWGAGIGSGDRVFTVSHTAVATVVAIERAGATPVLLDVDMQTLTLAPERLERALREDTGGSGRRAVLAVHLYGQPADMAALAALARRYELVVIEDCAQAHGGGLDGQPLGRFGAAAAFSFYPTKNVAALGDAGAVFTTDPALAARVRALREYGWRERYVSETRGMNSRLDELQAAILRVKLRHLAAEHARRRAVAACYDAMLGATGLMLPAPRPGAVHAWHQYVVRTPARDWLRRELDHAGIGTLIHYPVPVHAQPAYRDRLALDPAGLHESDVAAACVLSLPIHGHLSREAAEQVGRAVQRLLAGRRR
jgi:dTDP-4-amino-4,6-dideoxygalactose transaminase